MDAPRDAPRDASMMGWRALKGSMGSLPKSTRIGVTTSPDTNGPADAHPSGSAWKVAPQVAQCTNGSWATERAVFRVFHELRQLSSWARTRGASPDRSITGPPLCHNFASSALNRGRCKDFGPQAGRSQPSRPQRCCPRAIPSATASAERASSISGSISGSGRVNVAEKICQCRRASSGRPMRA